MKFSLVVINHNYADYVGEAIRSAQNQTYPHKEIIVVDDGSSDRSRMVIDRFGGDLQVIFQEQQGHVSAVNAGFAASRADAVLFLDADDLLYPECLSELAAVWRPSLSKIQFRLDTIDKDGRNQNAPFPYFAPDLMPEEVLRQSIEYGVYPWTVSTGNAFARSYLEKVMPIDPKRIYRSPDGFLNKLAPLYGQVESSSKILGAYRVHGRNSWANAGSELKDYKANRWLRFDRVLCDTFNERAEQIGLAPRAYDELVSLQRIEHRLLGFRSDREGYPFSKDGRLSLFLLGLRSVSSAPNVNLLGRLLWGAWFAVLAFAPYALVNLGYKWSRGQMGRAGLARLLVGLSRGAAASARAQRPAPTRVRP